MAMNFKDLITLAKATANANASSPVAYSYGDKKFSYNDMNDTLRSELNELAGTYQLYRENKNKVFSLIEETITDVLPKKVMEQYGQFAEIKTFAQGDRPVFTQKITEASRKRAKKFITKVGLAGVYEVFKLDGRSYEVPTSAMGAAVGISFEEYLDGRMDWATLVDIMMEGIDEAIYREIANAMIAATASIQSANTFTGNTFNETQMDNLISIVESYGPATIYCTREFAATMVPATGWISDNMRDQKWANGYLANYKGTRVIVLNQSYEDETNKVKVIDPSYAWIMPAGVEKPVKVAFEGSAQTREWEGKDWSRELHMYQKVGVAAMFENNVCVYRNTILTK